MALLSDGSLPTATSYTPSAQDGRVVALGNDKKVVKGARIFTEGAMSRPKPIEYAEATPEVRAVFDDIMATRKVEDVNNFWKYLARDPALLKRTWETQKEVLRPGALHLLVKEMIYLSVSVTNGCSYGIACHTALARKSGMTDEMFDEFMAVVGMANQTNRFADGYRVPIDAAFD